jgi:hypothetical protein
VRKAILGVAAALLSAGCSGASLPGGSESLSAAAIHVQQSPSPFSQITAGSVRAIVPDGWQPVPATYGAREGFFASPSPEAWSRMDGSIEGMAATWVDATRVGVPSDFYYLAATGPLLSGLISSPDCRAESPRVYADNLPGFVSGDLSSPGDYVARGEGTCDVRGRVTRWSYFVAAPGFGPVREVGIPRSGLYVVVAVTREGIRAGALLDRLIAQTRFGGARVRDFVAVFRERRP